jgi:hypothetical protein
VGHSPKNFFASFKNLARHGVEQKSRFLHFLRGVDFPCEFQCRIQAQIAIAVSVVEGQARKSPGHGFGSDIGPEVAVHAASALRAPSTPIASFGQGVRLRAPPRKEQSMHHVVDHAASGTRATCALAQRTF